MAEPLPGNLRDRLMRARDEMHTTRLSLKVRFLADADLNKAIVSGVLHRQPALDFLTAHAAGLRGLSDLEVLALATEQQRVLVSHDVGTLQQIEDRLRILLGL